MWQKIILKYDRYYEVSENFLQSVTGITKCEKSLLQSVAGTTIKKCDIYYKVKRNKVPQNHNDILRTGAQLVGGGGWGLPCCFLKIKKNALILGKKVLIVSILGLNLPFKM